MLKKGGLTVRQAVLFDRKDLIRDDLAGMMYGLLKAVRPDGRTVVRKLVDDGIANPDTAKEYGLLEEY